MAADLAKPEKRAQTIGMIVWATTIGSGFGSLVSLSASIRWAAPSACPTTAARSSPDRCCSSVRRSSSCACGPTLLVLAGGVGATKEEGRLPFSDSLKLILANPKARLAVIAMMVSQATMVGVMTLTPLYMKDGGLSKRQISVMLFMHILGMYALSLFIGRMTDCLLGAIP